MSFVVGSDLASSALVAVMVVVRSGPSLPNPLKVRTPTGDAGSMASGSASVPSSSTVACYGYSLVLVVSASLTSPAIDLISISVLWAVCGWCRHYVYCEYRH